MTMCPFARLGMWPINGKGNQGYCSVIALSFSFNLFGRFGVHFLGFLQCFSPLCWVPSPAMWLEGKCYKSRDAKHLRFHHSLTSFLEPFLLFPVQLVMVVLSFLSLFLATTALAAPSQSKIAARGVAPGACGADVPASAFNLPSSFIPLTSAPSYTTMAFGVQNYTCDDDGSYS